ncbi:MAG: MBL fold metallo-hydrolase, partial [Ketobacteraceae bacterium]|nr:MBL fold metallo-hydrolase [Ketobacteraceae bacterium]
MTETEKTGVRKLLGALGLIGLFLASGTLGFLISHHRGLSEAQRDWERRKQVELTFSGATDSLQILPLVNWHGAKPSLKTEMGVAYLVETDQQRILFDLGHNALSQSPSPLEFNMKELGIDMASINTFFISHNHFDHVGGKKWSAENTFATGLEQRPLGDVNIFTPVAMTYPGQTPVATSAPQVLSKAIATTGTLRRQLFMGRIDEQALVINL